MGRTVQELERVERADSELVEREVVREAETGRDRATVEPAWEMAALGAQAEDQARAVGLEQAQPARRAAESEVEQELEAAQDLGMAPGWVPAP
jgi:hypothetical protein